MMYIGNVFFFCFQFIKYIVYLDEVNSIYFVINVEEVIDHAPHQHITENYVTAKRIRYRLKESISQKREIRVLILVIYFKDIKLFTPEIVHKRF